MSGAQQQQSLFLITGNIQGGKTSFLTELIELLRKSSLSVGGFLAPGSFESGKGREWICESLKADPDVIVIDEVGPMEQEGSGWSKTLEFLKSSSVPVQLWSVREKLTGEVMEHWSISPDHLIHIDNEEVHKAANLIIRAVEKTRNS